MLSSTAALRPTDCGVAFGHCLVGQEVCAGAEEATAAMATATIDRCVRTAVSLLRDVRAALNALRSTQRRRYLCLPHLSMLPSLLGPRGRPPERFPRLIPLQHGNLQVREGPLRR